MDKHTLKIKSQHKGERCALVAVVVDMAGVAGALVVAGAAVVTARTQCKQ